MCVYISQACVVFDGPFETFETLLQPGRDCRGGGPAAGQGVPEATPCPAPQYRPDRRPAVGFLSCLSSPDERKVDLLVCMCVCTVARDFFACCACSVRFTVKEGRAFYVRTSCSLVRLLSCIFSHEKRKKKKHSFVVERSPVSFFRFPS